MYFTRNSYQCKLSWTYFFYGMRFSRSKILLLSIRDENKCCPNILTCNHKWFFCHKWSKWIYLRSPSSLNIRQYFLIISVRIMEANLARVVSCLNQASKNCQRSDTSTLIWRLLLKLICLKVPAVELSSWDAADDKVVVELQQFHTITGVDRHFCHDLKNPLFEIEYSNHAVVAAGY